MTWIVLGLLAGLVLGTYDFLTKLALKENTVLEVVFWCSVFGGLIWVPFFFIPSGQTDMFHRAGLYPSPLSLTQQVLILPKSLMMVATWIFSYYSVKAYVNIVVGAHRANVAIH